MSDLPDWQKAVVLLETGGGLMAGVDFPDWTDGVLVVTTPLAPPGDLPDWTKAVTEPPGLSPTPPVTAGLFAQYDAAQISGVADGSALATWPDVTGNGHDLTQSTTAKQPTFRNTVGGTVGGKPAVWFDGTDDSMANTGFPAQATYTTFSVFMPTPTPTAQEGVWYDHQTSATALWIRNSAYSFQFGAVQDLISTAPSTTVASVVAAWYDGTAGHISLNGGTAVTATSSGQLGAGITVGSFQDGVLVPFKGPICELIFYAGVLSSADMASVTTYLIARWG